MRRAGGGNCDMDRLDGIVDVAETVPFRWKGAGIADRAACRRDVPGIGAVNHHFNRIRLQPGGPQHRMERHAGPLGGAGGAVAPRLTIGWRVQAEPAVAGALQRHDQRATLQATQRGVGQRVRMRHCSLNRQSPFFGPNLRHRKVIAGIKEGGWRHHAHLFGQR